MQNKCIRFCLQLGNREHIGTELFDTINWLPIDQRFKQCLSRSIFKLFYEIRLHYTNEIYKTTNQKNAVTRNSALKLFQPLRTKALNQKCLLYLGYLGFIVLKMSNNANTFNHKEKKGHLEIIQRKRSSWVGGSGGGYCIFSIFCSVFVLLLIVLLWLVHDK